MIGVVVPVHNEEHLLGACLEAIASAAAHPDLDGEPVTILAALDSCTDGSAAIAAAYGVVTLEVDSHRVGAARAAGAERAVALGARWIACTDADTQVAPDWLSAQLMLDADAVCGVISVDDWSEHPDDVRRKFLELYTHADGHRHIHGANMGFSTQAYLRAGGFAPLAVSEDISLVQALIDSGARIAWSAAPRVTTSSRLRGRLRGGFADYLRKLDDRHHFAPGLLLPE
jgi:glycosyltransferase involved in cell wall biosynthesis